MLPYPVARILYGARFRLTRRLADRELSQVWPQIDAVKVDVMPFAGRSGNVTLYERLVLCAVAKVIGARTIFEFGTFDGLSTWHLAHNAGPQCRVITLDLPLEHPARGADRCDPQVTTLIHGIPVGACFAGTPEAARIEQIYSDSMEFDPAPYRAAVDLCFIDASHTYQHVSRDTESALVMVRPGGVIVWHDYSRWWRGVQRCLDDLSASLPVFRVPNTTLAVLRVPRPAVANTEEPHGQRGVAADKMECAVGAAEEQQEPR